MGHPANPSKALFRGAFILTVAAVITKVLSAFYRIPFQNIVGDIGFYIYQQVYPFYGTAVVLSTTGFPVVISKLYAEHMEKREQGKARLLLLFSFLYLQCFGILCFLVLFFGADNIAQWMNDPKLSILIKVVSLVFLTFPAVSVFRGYYQAIGEMVPTALSQVGEQTIRVLTILVLSYFFIHQGYSLYFAGGGAMAGSVTGSIAAMIILFMFLSIRKHWKGTISSAGGLNYFGEAKVIFKALFFQGIAICLSGMLMVFLQLADSLNLYSLLTASGLKAEAAKSMKGVFDRGQPLIQLGTVAATSMSLTLVPLITRQRLAANPNLLHSKIQLAVKVSFVIGIGASAGLWAIIKPTNIMLFKNSSGTSVLGLLSFVILFTSIILTVTAVMQGLGSLVFPAAAVTAVLPIKFFINLALIPSLATKGAAISSLVSLGLVSLALLWKLKRLINIETISARFIGTIAISAAIMAIFLNGYLFVFHHLSGGFDSSRIGAAIEALSGVGAGGFLFMYLIIRGKLFKEDELENLPMGSKLKTIRTRKDRS